MNSQNAPKNRELFNKEKEFSLSKEANFPPEKEEGYIKGSIGDDTEEKLTAICSHLSEIKMHPIAQNDPYIQQIFRSMLYANNFEEIFASIEKLGLYVSNLLKDENKTVAITPLRNLSSLFLAGNTTSKRIILRL